MRQDRGLIILVALFIAMVAFAAASVVTIRVRHNLDLASLSAKQVQRQAAARGAVDHLLSMLRRGLGNQYDALNPLLLDIDEVEGIKVWSETDANYSDIRHLLADIDGVRASKTVVEKPPLEAVIFYEKNNQVSARQPGDVSWVGLPTPPDTVYDINGNTISAPGIELQDMEANHHGQLFVELFGSGHFATVMWDHPSQTWTTLPPLPQFSFSGGQVQVQSGQFQAAEVNGVTEDKLYSVTNEGLAILDLVAQQWSYVPRLAGEVGRFSAAGDDRLVVQMNDPNTGAERFDIYQDGWSSIALPPGYTPRGIDPEGLMYAEDPNGATVQFDGNVQTTMSVPPSLQSYQLLGVDAEGHLVYAEDIGNAYNNGQFARWDLGTGIESFASPTGSGNNLFSDFRFLAGGGQPIVGAPSEFEVTSSY